MCKGQLAFCGEKAETELARLVAPTYTRDLKLCELLCESVDRYVTSFAKRVLVVPDSELPLFGKFNGEARKVAMTFEYAEGIRNFIASARDHHHVAFSASSISRTPIEVIRSESP
jgi:hypothetical protein